MGGGTRPYRSSFIPGLDPVYRQTEDRQPKCGYHVGGAGYPSHREGKHHEEGSDTHQIHCHDKGLDKKTDSSIHMGKLYDKVNVGWHAWTYYDATCDTSQRGYVWRPFNSCTRFVHTIYCSGRTICTCDSRILHLLPVLLLL